METQQGLGQFLPEAGEKGRGEADRPCWKEHLPDPGDVMPGVPSGVSGLDPGDFTLWKALPEPGETLTFLPEPLTFHHHWLEKSQAQCEVWWAQTLTNFPA